MNAEKPMPAWFYKLLSDAQAAVGGSRSELARALNTAPQTIIGWEKGGKVGADLLLALLHLAGGDISRALPSWSPSSSAPMVPVVGTVAAGEFDNFEDADIDLHPLWFDQWKKSRYWGLSRPVRTLYGVHEVVLVRVTGTSMEPAYVNGELLVCRTPQNVHDLPDRTPCIFSLLGEGETFKLLRYHYDGTPYAEPINPTHRNFLLNKEREYSVPYLVVGKFDPGTADTRASRITGIPGLKKGMK